MSAVGREGQSGHRVSFRFRKLVGLLGADLTKAMGIVLVFDLPLDFATVGSGGLQEPTQPPGDLFLN